MIESLNDNISKIMGWESDYYLTKKSEEIKEYETFQIIDKIKVRILIPEERDSDEFDVLINHKEFSYNQKPQEHDILFFDQKFYMVKCVFGQEKSQYRLTIFKYKQLTVIKPKVDESIIK
jgi:hypothetical protein